MVESVMNATSCGVSLYPAAHFPAKKAQSTTNDATPKPAAGVKSDAIASPVEIKFPTRNAASDTISEKRVFEKVNKSLK